MTDGDTPVQNDSTSESTNSARQAGRGPDVGGTLTLAWQYFVEDAVAWIIMGAIYAAAQVLLASIPLSGLLILGPLTGGMFYAAFMRMRGTPVTVGMLFAPAQTDLVPLLLVGLVVGLIWTVGAALCLIPLFLVFPLTMFAIPLVVERKLPFMDAVSLSISTTREQFSAWLVFGFINLLVVLAGALAAGLGVIVTVPLATIMIAIEYREVFGMQSL